MKILLNAIGVSMGGAEKHLRNFLFYINRIDKKNKYVLLLRRSLKLRIEYDNIKTQYFTNINHINRLYYDNFLIKKIVLKEKIDLIVSLSNFGPIKPVKSHFVLQGNSIYFCNYYFNKINFIKKLMIIFQKKLLYYVMKNADVVFTPSYSMRDMIKKEFRKLNNKKYIILYHGHSKEYSKVKFGDLDRNQVKFLYITYLTPYKGFDILIKALAVYKKTNPDFIFYTTISRFDWPKGYDNIMELIYHENLNDNIKLLGTLPQDEINYYYQNSDLMLYSSLCESFGFPMIEAIANELPIVAADTPINRELCKDAALYYSALNPNDFAAVIIKALEKNTYRRLKQNTKKVFDMFDWGWDRYVNEFLKIISEVHEH